MALFNCKHCGKEFNARPYLKKQFCSQDCYNKWRKENLSGENSPDYKKQKVNCSYCDNELLRTPYELKNKKDHFCNKECFRLWKTKNQKGENNPNYKGGNIKKECEWCGKEYDVKISRDEKTRFCSQQCQIEYLNKDNYQVKTNCAICEKEIYKKPSQIKEHNFCSLKCLGKWNSIHKDKKISKICVMCGKEYKVIPCNADVSITCSNECRYEWLSKVYSQLPEVKLKKINMLLNQKREGTKPELIVQEYLDNHNINYISQQIILNKYVADFFISELNLIIEVFGDYYHANPEKYGEGKKPLNEMQIKKVESDKNKLNDYYNNGYNVVVLWEKDIYKNVSFLLDNLLINDL